jgi:6-phosphogluconolactonase
LGAAVARIPKGTVDFSETFWIMVDERVVPKNHLDSNYRAVCEALSEFVSTSQILGIPDEALKTGATDLIAHEYEALLRARGIMPSAVALVLLGMGEDGHTASLFPHMSVELTNSPNSSFYIGVDDSPKAPPKRITLTLSAIHAAQKRVFVVTGKGKAAAIAHIFREGNSRRLPAGLVQDALWLVDEAAVSASSES